MAMAKSISRPQPTIRGRAAYGAAVVALASATSGCGGPQIDVLGSYFPSWMVCLAIGVAVSFVAHRIFARLDVDPNIGPKGLVYACLALAATLATWLAYFRE